MAAALRYAVTPRFAFSASRRCSKSARRCCEKQRPALHHPHQRESRAKSHEVARCFRGRQITWRFTSDSIWSAALRAGAQRSCALTTKFDGLAAHGARSRIVPPAMPRWAAAFFPCAAIERRAFEFALGTDVGGGTGFGMLKEALAGLPDAAGRARRLRLARRICYIWRRAPGRRRWGWRRRPAISAGKSADFVYLRPPEDSPLAGVWNAPKSLERILAALFTLAGAESVREVRVEATWCSDHDDWTSRSNGPTSASSRPGLFSNIRLGWPTACGAALCTLTNLASRWSAKWKLPPSRSNWRCFARIRIWGRARNERGLGQEQAGAGLDQLTPEEFERLMRLNTAYRRIWISISLCGEGQRQRRYSRALKQRFYARREDEFAEALRQVYRIARFAWRLKRLRDASIRQRTERNYYGKGDVIVYRLNRDGSPADRARSSAPMSRC